MVASLDSQTPKRIEYFFRFLRCGRYGFSMVSGLEVLEALARTFLPEAIVDRIRLQSRREFGLRSSVGGPSRAIPD
jgi:hypothetical protein